MMEYENNKQIYKFDHNTKHFFRMNMWKYFLWQLWTTSIDI